jgi:hypothetical protein
VSQGSATAAYRQRLHTLAGPERERYLRDESRLPGPRGNLELLAAAVEEATPAELRRWAALDVSEAPGNTPGEFVATVGAAGLGRLVVEGDETQLEVLRRLAADPRWRVREGVAMALQRIGAHEMSRLCAVAAEWANGSRYEQRAAVAGLAEPPLLRDETAVEPALGVFDTITASIVAADDARSDGFVALSKALGYGWSVLVAAAPEVGRRRIERWLQSDDRLVRRIMRENLSKARLARAMPAWTATWRDRLANP